MTIGFDGSRAFGNKRTGTENYSFHLLKNLAKIDRKNQYMVFCYPYSGENFKSWPKNFTFKIINWHRFWTQGGLALESFKTDLDVLFVPSHTLPIIRKLGLKTVMTVHDLGVEYLPKTHQFKQQLYLKNIIRYQFISATKLIAVSKATRDDLVKKIGINPGKISVIYEGYDKDHFREMKPDILVNSLRQYKLTPGSYFLFVGTVQPRKNLARLIKAFVKWSYREADVNSGPYPKLVIAGSKGWLSDKIYRLPKELGIEKMVKFLEYVPDKDMPALYCGAKALTFPSLFEGFGLPILEAQACGCPVLTSSVSSMPEVAGEGAILANPYSVDDIVKGFKDVVGTRDKLIKAGFENIQKFSWEKCASQTLELLENL